MDDSKINKTYLKFNKFLEACKVGKDETFTHYSMGEPYGRYFISSDDEPKFQKLYKKAILKNNTYHILEKNKPYAPIIVDIDFNIQKENPKETINERCYDSETIKLIVKIYNQAITKFLNVPKNKLQAFILEKDKPTDKQTYLKDGIHIIYPYVCAKQELRHAIRENVISCAEENNLFSEMNLINDMNNIFDKQNIQGGWLLYGSIKDENSPRYNLTKILAHDGDELPIDTYTDSELIDILSIRKFDSQDEIECNDNIDKDSIINKYNKVIY